MKKVLLAGILGLSLTVGAGADVIKVSADVWEPYNNEPGAVPAGYLVDILKAVFEKQGHTIKYEVLPYSRALKSVADGSITAVLGSTADDNKANGLLATSHNLGLSKVVFYVKKGNPWRYSGVKSLESVLLGMPLDYNFGVEALDAYITKNKDNANRISSTGGETPAVTNFRKLEGGHVGVIVDDASVAAVALKKNGWTGVFEYAGSAGEGVPVYIGFSPKDPKSAAYVKLLDQGIGDLRRSGQLAKILEAYGLKDWE